MGVSSGFFDSVNNDRRYSAETFGRIFTGIITDGVFLSVGEAFRVSAETTALTIYSGRAWCRGFWLDNDSSVSFKSQITNTHPNYSRYDMVALEFDSSTNVRNNDIVYVQGDSSSSPKKPTPKTTSQLKQIPLAYIFRPAGASTVNQSQVQTVIGTSECPYITGPLQTVHFDDQVRAANEIIRKTADDVNQIKTQSLANLEEVRRQAEVARQGYLGWIAEAQKILGKEPNTQAIVNAEKNAISANDKATRALTTANSAEGKASEAQLRINGVANKADQALANAEKYNERIQKLENVNISTEVSNEVFNRLNGTQRNVILTNRTSVAPSTDWREGWDEGAFNKLGIGYAFNVDGFVWRIAHFDYFFGLPVNIAGVKHHFILFPDRHLGTGTYYASGGTQRGYAYENNTIAKSHARVTQLDRWLSEAGFQVISFSDQASSAFSNGRTSQATLKAGTMWLPTESQIFGHNTWSQPTYYDLGWRSDQFALMQLMPTCRRTGSRYWLRSFITDTIPSGVDAEGRPAGWIWSQSDVGYRPYVVVSTRG